MSERPRTRRALVDAYLLVPNGARQFLGLLAEAGGVVLVGTKTVRQEFEIGIQRKNSRAPAADIQRLEKRDKAEFSRWRNAYREAGLWAEVGVSDWSPRLKAAGLADDIGVWWGQYRTDPEDQHLAEAAIMCEMDALLSANMNMVKRRDWQAITTNLGLSTPPKLCRRGRAIDWMLQEKGASKDMDRLLRIVIGTMYPTESFKTPLTKWARALKGTFPKLSDRMVAHLGASPEGSLQDMHRQESALPGRSVTREYLSDGRRPDGP